MSDCINCYATWGEWSRGLLSGEGGTKWDFFAYILTTNYAAFLCSPESFSAYATDHGRGFQIWNSSHITTHRVLLVRATSSKIVRGSGILNRIGMKFGNNVLKVNTHRSTEYFDSS